MVGVSLIKPLERLVLFTRYPQPGKAKTRLIPVLGPHGAADLQKQMTEHIIGRIRGFIDSHPVDFEVRYEGGNRPLMEEWLGADTSYLSQGRGDLGTRMERTFSEAFHQGVKRVVIVGSDCPGITKATLRTTFDLLSQFDLVLGPANDGGYYLIGLGQETPQLFQGIPWGTGQVRARTVEIAKRLGLQLVNIEPLDDVDRADDLEVWAHQATGKEDPVWPYISIVIPTLNEAINFQATLESIRCSEEVEIIVVDGGSSDETVELAKRFDVRLLTTAAGRARQVNAGALAANGDVLLFLHGDTRLPPGFDGYIRDILARPGIVAGAFALAIDGPEVGLRIIEMLANFRSRIFQMPYGDQGIFLRAELFRSIEGFPDMPIMEDFVFMHKLKKRGQIAIAPLAVKTSARRWLKLGILKTTLINQVVLLAYFLGSDPKLLARWYRRQKGVGN